eukprot:TRINITY_DN1035_c0_g1_i6.p1 TRINITY_DN1035_c0_g1~~TRINITY_DN1035_c0_g1_i6.p1  ORF type:complete len:265 (+),score=40.73 TRINITY_DN1035_c0_g1_i6:198-992(+)
MCIRDRYQRRVHGDMENEEHKKAVLDEFNRALARDHTRLTVNGFTALGLVEMTRKRTRESLAHVLCQPCPTCSGRGEVKTARTVAYEILRELLREARQFNAREYRILAGPDVVDLFLDEESQALAMLSDFIGKSVSLQSEPSYSPEQYDIVLMQCPIRRQTMKTEPEFDSLVPPQTFDRRSFLVTSLGAGFALATQPVMAQTAIKTDETGLIAGEIKVPVKDGEMVAYRAVPGGLAKPPVVLVVSEILEAKCSNKRQTTKKVRQ